MSNKFELTGADLSQFLGQKLTDLSGIEAYVPQGDSKKSAELAQLVELASLLEKLETASQQSGINKWFLPGTPFGIENCPKHMAFFAAGAKYNERLFLAGNRCLPAGTLVATPNGPVAIETIKEGDWVYDRYANPTRVVATWDNGIKQVIDLTSRNKKWMTCTPDHELDTVLLNLHSLKWDVNKNKEIRCKAEDQSDATLVRRAYPVAPLGSTKVEEAYVLGAMLGDGCCTSGNSLCVVISSADEKIPNKIATILDTGYKRSKGSYSWRIAWEGSTRYKEWLDGRLCHEKILDLEDIKTWDRNSLINLAAGLIDTDGSLSKNSDGFTLSFHNQSKSAIDVFAYAVLALWCEDVTIALDERAKYVNGPVYRAYIRNPHAIKRIITELEPYLVHKYKADISGIDNIGKRSRSEAIKLTPSPLSYEAHVYDITVEHPEHFFLLANGLSVSNCGKSVAGAFEAACHATGVYPDWWIGKRFDRPTKGWAVGSTARATRDTAQKELIGPIGAWGTGMIPSEKFGKFWALAGVPQGIDIIQVKHVSGGWSTIGFKNYEQPLPAFYGTDMDWIWLDEECPSEHYNECLIRTMTTDGIVLNTFTPLKGLTPHVVRFSEKADYLAGAQKLIGVQAPEDEHGEDARLANIKTHKAIVQAGWDDAPWLSEEKKLQMEADTEPHLREARRSGKPSMGSGNVYPIAIESLLVEPFKIPDYFKRMFAMDVGWNRTACLWAAIDPQTDTVYIYDEHYMGEAAPPIHAAGIRNRGNWIPGVIDPASRGRTQNDGTQLIKVYKDLGLQIMPANNEVEAGIQAVWQRMTTGNLKVFNTLHNFAKEFVLYRRDLRGKIVKDNDHLMDCLRYIQNNINRAKSLDQLRSTPNYSGGKRYNI